MVVTFENIALIGSLILFISIIAGKAGFRFGVPILVLFLFVGMLFGCDGLGIEFHNPHITQFIGVISLSIILFSGGMDTKYREIKPIVVQGLVLANLGVFLTALFTGLFIYWITQSFWGASAFSLLEAFLLASVMSSTDSAAVFTILGSRGIALKERLKPLLELESGSNDPMAYLLTISFIQLIQFSATGDIGVSTVVMNFISQLLLGGIMGYGLGRFAVFLLNKINFTNDALYPILLMTIVIIVFSLTHHINGNGYLAVYISGLVIGNSKFINKHYSKRFFDGLTWLAQIVMFLTLGLMVNPSEFKSIALIGIAISFFMIIIGRPLSVALSLLPFRKMSIKAKVFTSWVGLRGAVPIIFATYPLIAGIGKANMIFNIVFFVTLVSLLVQGTTVFSVAKWLNLIGKYNTKKQLLQFEVELSDDIMSAMTEVIIEKDLLKKGNSLKDLELPKNTLVIMVKREERYFIPDGKTTLEPKDVILLISDDEERLLETQKRLSRINKEIIAKKPRTSLKKIWFKLWNTKILKQENIDLSE